MLNVSIVMLSASVAVMLSVRSAVLLSVSAVILSVSPVMLSVSTVSDRRQLSLSAAVSRRPVAVLCRPAPIVDHTWPYGCGLLTRRLLSPPPIYYNAICMSLLPGGDWPQERRGKVSCWKRTAGGICLSGKRLKLKVHGKLYLNCFISFFTITVQTPLRY